MLEDRLKERGAKYEKVGAEFRQLLLSMMSAAYLNIPTTG